MTLSSYSSRSAAVATGAAFESRAMGTGAELSAALDTFGENTDDSPASLTSVPPLLFRDRSSRSEGTDPLSAASRDGGGMPARVAASTPVRNEMGSSNVTPTESAGAATAKRLSCSSPPPTARSTGEGRANMLSSVTGASF